jgi:hypothetical protein
MIRIAITQEAFNAIVSTMNLGNVGFENEVNDQGASAGSTGQWCSVSTTCVIHRRPSAR